MQNSQYTNWVLIPPLKNHTAVYACKPGMSELGTNNHQPFVTPSFKTTQSTGSQRDDCVCPTKAAFLNPFTVRKATIVPCKGD